jgi:hypothetical protein
MTVTQLQHAAVLRRRVHRRPPALASGDRTDATRIDARRAHTALLAVLIGLAAATVAYAIVRDTTAALAFLALIGLQIRTTAVAAFGARERADRPGITFIP